MKKLTFILFMLFPLSACQNMQDESFQRYETNRICTTLIEGLLKASQHTNFQLWQKKELSDFNTEYWYRQSSEHGVTLDLPENATLKFQCENQPQQYTIKKIATDLMLVPVLSLQKTKL